MNFSELQGCRLESYHIYTHPFFLALELKLFEFNYLSDNSWENLISSPAKKKIPQQNKTFVFRREDGSAVR